VKGKAFNRFELTVWLERNRTRKQQKGLALDSFHASWDDQVSGAVLRRNQGVVAVYKKA
jgi:hypothetical protein